jgi:zinc/manganese transport system substrate-binding protein
MKKFFALVLMIGLALASSVEAKIVVGASLPDLGSIAASVGGDRVDVFAISRAVSDPHNVEVLPSYMVRMSRADLYLKVGLSLDQWADGIIDGARNSKLKVVDCSKGIPVLEKPTGKVDASMGDVHPEGNPHYWLNPQNAAIIAQTVHDALVKDDPAGKGTYDANLDSFSTNLASHLTTWKDIAARLTNHAIITYHSSWPYFANAFGFTIAAKVEPVPGIPPTGRHLAELVDIIRQQHVAVVIQEPYFADDGPNYLARETGVRVVKLSPSCADVSPGAYFAHFDQLLAALRGVSQ